MSSLFSVTSLAYVGQECWGRQAGWASAPSVGWPSGVPGDGSAAGGSRTRPSHTLTIQSTSEAWRGETTVGMGSRAPLRVLERSEEHLCYSHFSFLSLLATPLLGRVKTFEKPYRSQPPEPTSVGPIANRLSRTIATNVWLAAQR